MGYIGSQISYGSLAHQNLFGCRKFAVRLAIFAEDLKHEMP